MRWFILNFIVASIDFESDTFVLETLWFNFNCNHSFPRRCCMLVLSDSSLFFFYQVTYASGDIHRDNIDAVINMF